MRRIIIFGGTGFIGLNLTKYFLINNPNDYLTLVSREAVSKAKNKVKLFVDNNQYFKRIKLIKADITNQRSLKSLLKSQSVVINLAGYSGAVNCLKNPQLAIEINTIAHLSLLEACRKIIPKSVILLASSRLEYGIPETLPVKPEDLRQPNSVYGIAKFMASTYSVMYHQLYGLKTVTFCISNPYGSQIKPTSTSYNLLNHFIDQAKHNRKITIFGDGQQQRDYIYIDDVCSAINSALKNSKVYGQTLNLGSGKGISLKKAAQTIIKTVGRGRLEFTPWPKNWQSIETGDFYFDINQTKKILNWFPGMNLISGIKKTEIYNRISNYHITLNK